MNPRHPLTVLGVVALLLVTAVRSFAGGPLLLRAPGQPFLWPNGGRMIPFNPDQGALGTLTNAQAVAQTADAFRAWADIPSATATHQNAGALPEDVNENNFEPYFFPEAPDGLTAIVYDENGAIFDLLFGPGSGILGFAGPEWVDTDTGAIVEGVGFMNGGVLLEVPPFPVEEMLSIQVHEFGHLQNLAHTVINGQIPVGDATGPSPFDTFPPESLVNRIETMYPFLYIDGGMATPHRDDIAMFSTLYPEPTFAATTGTITGRIVAPNNRSLLTGVNVIARNIANPYDDVVSAISSDFTDDFTPGRPLVGVYTLRGLTPGADYAVYVDQIEDGGFSTPPRILPGPEEFYNGAAESDDPATDPPGNDFAAVRAFGGQPVGNVNIIFNDPPNPLPAGDDTFHEIFPAFTFEFGGERYESVWVNANGNLTFGAPSADFSETTAELLTGPPRIAALWDDLNPSAAPGSVAFSESRGAFTVTFTNVPHHQTGGANSFAVTLFAGHGHGDDGEFRISYGDISATGGIAGYSVGGRLASGFELETDLSTARSRTLGGHGMAAVFEAFTGADNDLDNRRFDFDSPGRFRDRFEPNDSPVSGDHHGVDCDHDDHDDRGRGLVRLPFNTVDRFSEVHPGDVDFFRFRASAGDILAIETLPGLTALDTVIGIFDDEGTLLLSDDDGGAGLLSRLLVQIAVDGVYSVGVSTFPDFNFTGAGEDAGRYVLNISKYRGTVLDFGTDPLADPSVGIALSTFEFPFQGQRWSSLFVNDNGNLTFGAGSDDFSETVPEFLAGPPRIAALWDDLNALGGLIIAEEEDHEVRVHFVSVPEFFVTGSNYFTFKLDRRGNISIDYGATNRSDGLVGVTQGGGMADPGPIDISRAWRLSADGTTYEQFSGVSFGTWGGVDLSFREIEFRKPR
jgi:hypothetical protein